MKKTLCFIIISIFLSVNLSRSLYGAFEDVGWGVRPLGMGAAFTAVSDDANAPLYNPAGIAQVEKREVTFMSSRLFTGLDGVEIGLNYFSYVQPLNKKYGAVSLSWASLYAPALYREDTAVLNYARSLNDIFKSKYFELMAGVSAKYLRHEYSLDQRTIDDPVFASGSSKAAMTCDAGLLLSFQKTGITLGYASRNMTSPDVGLKTQDIVTIENAAGVSYYTDKLPILGLPFFTVDIDAINSGSETDYRFGAETWLLKGKFPLRAGARKEEITAGTGYEFSIGGGAKLVLDYSFAWPLEVEQTMGSHRLGITVKF